MVSIVIFSQLKIMYDNHLNIMYDNHLTLLTILLITITGKYHKTEALFIYICKCTNKVVFCLQKLKNNDQEAQTVFSWPSVKRVYRN